MGDLIKNRIYSLVTAVMGLLILMTALLCVKLFQDTAEQVNERQIRCDIERLVSRIEESEDVSGSGSLSEPEMKFAYAVVLIDGTVAPGSSLLTEDKVNLHTLGSTGTNLYTVPLVKDGEQFGTLVADLTSGSYEMDSVLLMHRLAVPVIMLLLSTIAFVILLRTFKRDVFEPVQELHAATKDILTGTMDQAVRYDYDGEIGTLCHDFELMRTELRDSLHREQQMKEDEKILMANISHDLKTPLATVQGYLESICLGVVSGESDTKECCEKALNKTLLLGKMTEDILEHSKAELKQLSIEKTEVYTADYFGQLLSGLASDVRNQGFELHYDKIPNRLIELDPVRIAQVMENLVGNAVKYGHEHGHIEVTCYIRNREFHVLTKDDGPGVQAADLPFLFERFYRGDLARTMSVPGSGLGLSIAKYIVEQHGGRMECDSVFGQGLAVEFYIRSPHTGSAPMY